jgi:hypothetical protein
MVAVAHRGLVWRVVVTVVVLGSVLAWPSPAGAAGYSFRRQAELLPGVVLQGLSGNGISLDVGRIGRGAPVHVEVIASGAVAGGVETTSAVCRRVGGILCVNGDFASCRTCTNAIGGIIHDSALQRSPVGDHPQLWLGASGPGAGSLGWTGSLEASVTYRVAAPPGLGGLLAPGPPTERTDKVSLGLDAVNRDRVADQVVLYTPQWGATTTTPNGGGEAVFGGSGPNVSAAIPVSPRQWNGNAGNSAIPGDGVVLSAVGTGTARLQSFWAKAADPAAVRRTVTLRAAVDHPTEESVGGHPVIMANGHTLIADSRDPFAVNRNPRTLVGWNPAGDLFLVTVDGRQPGHSQGVSLVEATDVLRNVGATNGFNLDGGGSTTFVSLPPGSRTPQVLNQPSDGTERRVTTVLAVVPTNPAAVRVAAAGPPAPPPPPPAPPGPPPPDEASTDGLPARPAPAPAPTTTVAPTTTAAPVTTPPVTEPVAAAPEAPDEVAAPPPAPPVAPADPGGPATGVPGTIAALALAAAAAATFSTARRTRHR